ncbi:MAG: hypothetical protein IJ099_04405 [Alphaproteobacteria bacterium]|nr:hypothetical protein [Alphaproteobacteria bacterium]
MKNLQILIILSLFIGGLSACMADDIPSLDSVDNTQTITPQIVEVDATDANFAASQPYTLLPSEMPIIRMDKTDENAPRKIIRTPEGANELDLETPLRCNVNWETQQMILTLPYTASAFKLERNGINNPLPRFEVTGFSFDMMPTEQAIVKLTKEAGIRVSSADGPYTSISATDLKGELSAVIKMMADSAGIYYQYDAKEKVLTLSRHANMTLYTPHSRPILLGLLDVIRGAGITNIVTNWADYSITFDADMETKNKMVELINTFENNPTLIAYDVSVFRLYPYDQLHDIEWKEMLKAFDFGSITTAQSGVIGRILTTSNDINIETLQKFLGNQAQVQLVSEGKFVVPNLWMARFDIGKCSQAKANSYGLSVLAKASLEKNNNIFSDITLEETNGQVTSFKIRNKLGDNFLIIGLPNELFGIKSPKSETIIFMVPRIIRTLKTNEKIKNKI